MNYHTLLVVFTEQTGAENEDVQDADKRTGLERAEV